MNRTQENVKKFMQMFGQECPVIPKIPARDILYLRAKLILEEALETVNALGFKPMLHTDGGKQLHVSGNITLITKAEGPDMVDIVDGLSDLRVVSEGTACALGVDMAEIDEEVDDNNFQKVWTAEQINNENIIGNSFCIKPSGYDKTFIVKNLDGKVIKPPGHKPPRIREILIKQGMTNDNINDDNKSSE